MGQICHRVLVVSMLMLSTFCVHAGHWGDGQRLLLASYLAPDAFFLKPAAADKSPLRIMPEARFKTFVNLLPRISDPVIHTVVHGWETYWYDKASIVPGYQDSYGDNSSFPVGMRPNTVQKSLVAPAGGWDSLFARRGEFHFPFGRPTGVNDAQNTFVVNFWSPPRINGKPLPTVWWNYQPNTWTRRIEWMFPRATIFGEVIFIINKEGKYFPLEVRTRERTLTDWTVDIFRPFPTARDLAEALRIRRPERPEWANSASIQRLIDHLENEETLVPASLTTTNFNSSWARVDGFMDFLPALDDNSILEELLRTTTFKSVKAKQWKQTASVSTSAASTRADFSIVPKNFNAGLFEVSDAFCSRCHQDAGRPIRDFYRDVMLYGEIWGEDETFSWHPFDASRFVDSSGTAININPDNRKFRQDFLDAGILEQYSAAKHPASEYRKIPRAWKGYVYQ
jgi:hypothetical protein